MALTREVARQLYDERIDPFILIKEPHACWIPLITYHNGGYRGFKYKGRNYRAHRITYMAFIGELKDDEFVCHKCDCRPCCNPEHLFAGSNFDNRQDSKDKGRTKWKRRYL